VSTVFVDTIGFFALYARNDADHPSAVNLFRQASSERWQLVTTNAVSMETHALLLNRVRNGRTVALDSSTIFGSSRRERHGGFEPFNPS
jgi:predicted nucleic acid-binding protein